MKHLISSICLIISVIVMSACSSSRSVVKSPMIGNLTGQAYAEKVIELAPQWESLSGKVALNLNLEGTKDMKVSATLRLKRGESIQVIVAPLLGIEVARLEISPDGLLAIDRMGKRYAQVNFDELSSIFHVDVSYEVLQSLFLNEVFLPGKSPLKSSDANSFQVSLENSRACLDVKSSKVLTYRFYTSAEQGLLEETRIGVSGMPYRLTWTYDSFQNLDQRMFPQHMLLDAEGGSKTAKLDMKFSRLSVGGDWESRTEVSSKYKRIGVDDLLKLLKN